MRPLIHFTAETGWINDPYGVTWHEGRYHLFMQYVPGSTHWRSDCHWGHATSSDLLHWEHEPVALTPGAGAGCWSGSIATDPATGTVLFFSDVREPDLGTARARIARPVDSTWRAWSVGPVVAELPAGVDVEAYRDPFVFRDGTSWRMLIGGGLRDRTAVVWSYRSEDLLTWAPDGLLASRHGDERDPWLGDGWECPQLLRVGDDWVLIVGVWQPTPGPISVAYGIGSLNDGRFVARHWDTLVFGPAYYATSGFADLDGRPCVMHWMRDVVDPRGAWAGAESLPHVLSVRGDRVCVDFHPTLSQARVGAAAEITGKGSTSAVADLEWSAIVELPATLRIDDTLTIVLDGEHLTATTAAGSWSMPCESAAVRIVLDRVLCEISADGALMGLPLAGLAETAELHVSSGRVHAFALG